LEAVAAAITASSASAALAFLAFHFFHNFQVAQPTPPIIIKLISTYRALSVLLICTIVVDVDVDEVILKAGISAIRTLIASVEVVEAVGVGLGVEVAESDDIPV